MSDTVGSVAVEVVPDARGWSEKLRAQIRDTTAKVDVQAETADADAQIDEVARNRTSKIKVETDKSGLSSASSSLEGMVKNVSLLPALFIAAGAAAVPLAAAVGGIAAALAAPLVVAGGGVGLFAIFGALAAKQTESQLKNIDTLQKKLSGLTKGTATYAATQKDLLAAQAALTPAQHRFADSLDGLKDAFSGFLAGKTGQTLLTTIASGMDLLSKTLPIVAPVLAAVSTEMGHLLDQLGRAAGSNGFADFIHDFARQVGPDIDVFAHVAGNLAKGFGGLFLALDNKKLSGGVLDGLLQLSQNFANLGQGAKGSEWLRDFIDYFHKVGPQVADTVGAVAKAVGHLVTALAPLGPPVLHIIKGIADALSSIPTPVLTGLLAATAGVSAVGYTGSKVFQAKNFLSKVPGLGGLAGGGSVLGGKGGVVPVFVTNEGFGGPGGGLPGGGETSAAGKIANTLPLVATLYGAYKVGQARGDAEEETWKKAGASSLVTYAQALFQQKLKTLPYTPQPMHTLNVGPIALSVPNQSKSLNSTSTALDAIRQHAASASQQLDRIGPNATASLAGAIHTVGVLAAKVDALHDKKFTIIAQTQSAISSLERLQAYRIQNKSFTVYQRSQAADRNLGPGGGIGVTPSGSGPPPPPHSGHSGGGRGHDIHTHVNLDGRQIAHVVTPIADDVYHANRAFEDQAAGR